MMIWEVLKTNMQVSDWLSLLSCSIALFIPFIIIRTDRKHERMVERRTICMTSLQRCYESAALVTKFTTLTNRTDADIQRCDCFYQWYAVHVTILSDLYKIGGFRRKVVYRAFRALDNILERCTHFGSHIPDTISVEPQTFYNVHNIELEILESMLHIPLGQLSTNKGEE